ncbi:LANO_0B06458g1_1 [Lachancea nothofagi CBS 11611]|uniref:LANO_0B06458g1_1 n=1 Tax=Lachancea nothofagi CBS 11611 TaxID=1266666 RepID=A0A1G4IZQ9_9SACH|nr:LANO_0B06458g1_1 [Lachancea nothofagi CBS 11611]
MIKNGIRFLARQLHVQHSLNKSQVKEKLTHLERNNEVLKRSRKEQERQAEKRRVQLKKLNKTSYTKQHARHVLKNRYEVSNESLSSTELGPTSGSDLRFLKLTHDKRMMYTILGVTGEQLRDSKLVAGDVAKFLARNQLEKAVFLARLAKSRGIVGMNKIMEHFCREQQDAKSAIDLYSWRKKWGIPPNELTHTLLFDGLANLPSPLSEKHAQRVLKIATQLIEKDGLNQMGLNAALSALVNSENDELVFKLFDAKPKNVIGDAITYTLLLRGAAKIKDDMLCMTRVDDIMARIPKRFMDARIMYEYCRVWHHRRDSKLSMVAAIAIEKYFGIKASSSELQLPEGVRLPDLQYWDIKQPYRPDSFLIDLLFENYEKNRNFDLASETYKELTATQPKLMRISVYERMIKMVTSGYPTRCAQMAVCVFKDMDAHHKINKNSMLLVYKSFERQAGKKFTNATSANIDELLDQLFEFATSLESKHWKDSKTKILNWKAWMFCWNVINKCNERHGINAVRSKWVLDQFIMTIVTGQTKLQNLERQDYAGMKHVNIESVRFLSSFAEMFKSPAEINEAIDGPERDNFLYRRLLLRLKDRILDQVDLIEGKSDNAQSVEEALRQTAQKLQLTKMPSNLKCESPVKASTQQAQPTV